MSNPLRIYCALYLAQLERQQARLLDVYLAEMIEREEFERRRKEVAQTQRPVSGP